MLLDHKADPSTIGTKSTQVGQILKITHFYLLSFSIKRNELELSTLLVQRSADLEHKCGEDGRTVLFVASELPTTKMTATLLKAGANVNPRTQQNATPLGCSF